MKCNFLGIGVQKSASTWVYRVLEDHPQFAVSNPKELDFFSYHYEKGISWYEDHFNTECQAVVAAGEISPSYFNCPEAIERAKAYNPDLKIVVTLRDPVDRAYSNHLHLIRISQYEGDDNSFESGMNAHDTYLDQSKYYTHLKPWFEAFPREQILVLIQEDIQKNPEKASRKLYEFLDMDSLHKSKFLYKRANVSFTEHFKGVELTLKFFGKVARKLGLSICVEKFKANVFFIGVRNKNRKHLQEIISPMSDKTRIDLYQIFSEDVLQLQELIGVESLPWKTWQYAVKLNKL